MKAFALITGLLALIGTSVLAQVACEQTETDIVIKRHGKHVLTYNKTDTIPAGVDSKYARSGFIHPISTPSGRILTDGYPLPHHGHQHGLFFAWRKATFEGEELNFWEHGEATVRHDKVLEIINDQESAGFRVQLAHTNKAKTILHEIWTVRVHAATGHVDLTSEQTCATTSPITLNKFHYGAMAIRGSRQWFQDAHTSAGKGALKDEFVEPCTISTNEGLTQKDGNHSRPQWVCISGAIDGAPVALTFVPHPTNFRYPQHVRLHPSMPYFCFIPTVEEPFQIVPGEAWVSRYRIIAQDGQPDSAKLNEIQKAFAADSPPMVFPGNAWEKATPASQRIDSVKLQSAVDYLKANAPRDGVNELVIIRHGRLVHHGPDIDKMHGVWSCTKSFTSTVLGLLVEDEKCHLDTFAKDHVPEMAAAYPKVTLRHFTTMTSGYRAVGDEPRGSYLHGPSKTPFRPSPEPLYSPGSMYAYWDSAMNQFGNVLTQIAGEPIEALFKRRIANPIGMDPDQWNWGAFGEVNGITVNGGSGNSGKHIQISAREMARFGHLLVNRGKWNGKQLISPDWIDEATKVQVPAAQPLGHPASNIPGPGMYGLNWWVNGIKPDGNRKWPGAPAGTFAAMGHHNNLLFVIPEWKMVIVRLGLDETGKDGFKITDEIIAKFLTNVGEAIVDTNS